MSITEQRKPSRRLPPAGGLVRVAFVLLLLVAFGVVYVTNKLLTDRFTENTRNRAELRLVLYSGNLLSELRQNAVVPQLLARDPELITALGSGDYTHSSARLISFLKELGAASLMMLDRDGRVVAATDRKFIGARYAQNPVFVDALRSRDTIFHSMANETGGYNFFYSRRIDNQQQLAGVIVVEVDLQKYQRAWAGISDAVLVTDSEGRVVLATEPLWRGLNEQDALLREPPARAIRRATRPAVDWGPVPAERYFWGDAVMRVEGKVPFRGWRITSFSTYANIRERVNSVLALEIMGFAILLALAFFYLNRRARLRMILFQRESTELRALNARLQSEIAERERVQENLAVAEQTLAQSSKLAALGEMSAAVSHELNQPLAAMKTYLAGSRLLLKRNRPDEAATSFQRIDDLIERMGAITKQLKSYARQSGGELQRVDLADSLGSALSMMEPQLRERAITIRRILPDQRIIVMGDPIRIEQVIVNLLRNALDATETIEEPLIEILLASGETAVLTVRDNGHGIENLENLFEPFYTTKRPGDGVGLGLAISSGIVSDLGGRLTARNGSNGGAVFEMQLPIEAKTPQAAE